jgi:peptide/nickel transport system permease protein
MTRYVLSRVAQAALVIVGISIAAFLLIHFVPGDPARVIAGPRASPDTVARVRAQLGLDDSLVHQYGTFVSGFVTGNLGDSLTQHDRVAAIIGHRIVPSLLLVVYSLVIALVVAVPLAVLAATHRNGVVDHVIRIATTVSFVMPTFWLALLLVLLLGLQLGLFPTSGYDAGLGGHLRSLTLPAASIGLYVAPVLLRALRSSLIDALRADYVAAARSHGFSERRVVVRHALRNSLLPLVTLVGVFAGGLLSASVVAENVFAIPGLGSLLVTAVTDRDFPTVQALTMLFGVFVVAINLATDLLYMALDPRVRL